MREREVEVEIEVERDREREREGISQVHQHTNIPKLTSRDSQPESCRWPGGEGF